MSHSALGVRAVYNGSGSTGPFTLEDVDANPILFEQNSEIIATHYDSDGVASVLTLTVDYTLTGAGSSSAGSLTLVTALAVGEQLVIMRSTALTQTLDLTLGGALSLEDLEDGLDKLTRITQELSERVDRTVILPITTSLSGIDFPDGEADSYIGWNSAGDALENKGAAATILNGSGAPASELGENGDFYLDTDTSDLYGPKSGGSWGSATSLIGATGATGAQGPAINWRGAWATSTSYAVADGVENNGSSFICISAHTSSAMNEPGVGASWQTRWDYLAQRGAAGVNGVDGEGSIQVDLLDDISASFNDATTVFDLALSSTPYVPQSAEYLMVVYNGVVQEPDEAFTVSGSQITFTFTPETGADCYIVGFSSSGAGGLTNTKTVALGAVIYDGGAVIGTGVRADISIPFNGTITGVRLLADQTGSCVVDIWKDTYANFPPTDADSITASATPTLSSASKYEDTTLTGWTTDIDAGDILRFNIDSVTTITRLTIQLTILKD